MLWGLFSFALRGVYVSNAPHSSRKHRAARAFVHQACKCWKWRKIDAGIYETDGQMNRNVDG